MGNMIGLIRALLGMGPSIAEQIRLARRDVIEAKNDQARIAADVTLARLEAQEQVLRQGGLWVTAVQVGFALPFIVYNAKLMIWDKVLGLGATDPLSPELYSLQSVVVGFFFVTVAVKALR